MKQTITKGKKKIRNLVTSEEFSGNKNDLTVEKTGKLFLPSEKNGDIVMQRVIVSFHVKLLLPFAEAVQTVVSVVCNL